MAAPPLPAVLDRGGRTDANRRAPGGRRQPGRGLRAAAQRCCGRPAGLVLPRRRAPSCVREDSALEAPDAKPVRLPSAHKCLSASPLTSLPQQVPTPPPLPTCTSTLGQSPRRGRALGLPSPTSPLPTSPLPASPFPADPPTPCPSPLLTLGQVRHGTYGRRHCFPPPPPYWRALQPAGPCPATPSYATPQACQCPPSRWHARRRGAVRGRPCQWWRGGYCRRRRRRRRRRQCHHRR